MFKQECILLTPTTTTNNRGDTITINTEILLQCDEKSIGESEFYQAQQSDLRPEITLEINYYAYQGQRKIRYKGTEYNVLRTFKSGDFIDLVLVGADEDG